jgi:hypothetical protein
VIGMPPAKVMKIDAGSFAHVLYLLCLE